MDYEQILTQLTRGDSETEALLAHVGAANPFCTVEYGRAMQALGREVWVVALKSSATEEDGALACLRKGRLSVELEFPSLPAIARDVRFWDVVDRLCRKIGVTDIVAASFGSPSFELPALRGELSRHSRQEFLLPLRECDPASLLGTNHKRNVKKAQKAGVTIRRTRENVAWLSDHALLIGQSAQRRLARGEAISIGAATASHRVLLENGAAELFQAVLGNNVVSSVLVLLSPHTGYYESVGSSPEGMATGASHFLIHGITGILKDEGRDTFNLGGAAEGSTLARFKLGFGPETRVLQEAACYVGPVWKRKLRSAIHLVSSDRERLISVVTGSSTQLQVFGLNTETALLPPLPPVPEARLEPLTEEQLATLPCPADDPDFRSRQLERLQRSGKSHAYAVHVGNTIAHISWLLPPAVVAADDPQILQLREGEAEITGCETAAEFRGKGLYGYAIQCLAILAREQGVRRIYMKTQESNVASQRGIQKAGLSPIGSIRLMHPPLAPSRTIVRRMLKQL